MDVKNPTSQLKNIEITQIYTTHSNNWHSCCLYKPKQYP